MELFYFLLFMLFFAALAAGYFYLQRAKARDAAPAEASAEASAAPAEAPAEADLATAAAAASDDASGGPTS